MDGKNHMGKKALALKECLDDAGVILKNEYAISLLMFKLKMINIELERKYARAVVRNIDSRIKSYDSILKKLQRKSYDISYAAAVEKLNDIAGIRAVCFIVDDVYEIAEYLKNQGDLILLKEKDYIRDCLVTDPNEDGGIVFDVMLKGTVLDGVYDLDTYLDILFSIRDKECMRKAFASMKARNSWDDYYMPGNLKDIHQDLVEKNSAGAEQVQRIAELFLICFRLYDPNEQLLLEKYFENLPNHQGVREQMLKRLKSIYK